jgi:hypothetical protein
MNLKGLQVKVFKNVSENERAPAFKAIVCDPANDYAKVGEISFWYADERDTGDQKLDGNGNPFLIGKVQDPYVKPTS